VDQLEKDYLNLKQEKYNLKSVNKTLNAPNMSRYNDLKKFFT
jgi:ribosomal protein L29